MTWHAGKRAYERGLQYHFLSGSFLLVFVTPPDCFFANGPQTAVYFTTWRAYGIYPHPNWLQQFYQDKDIR